MLQVCLSEENLKKKKKPAISSLLGFHFSYIIAGIKDTELW